MGNGEDNAVIVELPGDSDATESVHAKDIYHFTVEALGEQCRIIQFKVKLYLEVDEEERWKDV